MRKQVTQKSSSLPLLPAPPRLSLSLLLMFILGDWDVTFLILCGTKGCSFDLTFHHSVQRTKNNQKNLRNLIFNSQIFFFFPCLLIVAKTRKYDSRHEGSCKISYSSWHFQNAYRAFMMLCYLIRFLFMLKYSECLESSLGLLSHSINYK